jgi:hypothetical protein
MLVATDNIGIISSVFIFPVVVTEFVVDVNVSQNSSPEVYFPGTAEHGSCKFWLVSMIVVTVTSKSLAVNPKSNENKPLSNN